MTAKHDDHAAEDLIEAVIKDDHLKAMLKKAARAEEEALAKAKSMDGDETDEGFDNLPV